MVNHQVDGNSQTVVNNLLVCGLEQDDHCLLDFGLQDDFDELFHSGNVGDDSEGLAADLLIVDLNDKVHKCVHELGLYQLVLGVGHQRLSVVKQHVGQAAQYAGYKLLQ